MRGCRRGALRRGAIVLLALLCTLLALLVVVRRYQYLHTPEFGEEAFSVQLWRSADTSGLHGYRMRASRTVGSMFSSGTPRAKVEALLGNGDYENEHVVDVSPPSEGHTHAYRATYRVVEYTLGEFSVGGSPWRYALSFHYDSQDRYVGTRLVVI